MNVTYATAAFLASPVGSWGYGWGAGGWWLLWSVFKIVLIAGLVWLAVRYVRTRHPSGIDSARGILAERYARGELSVDEYRERLEQLRS